jgi:hypothetical protein
MDKNEVRQRINIVDLIGQTVKLTKDGDHYKGLCPFHDDHSPSLVVYPETRRWNCFGCNMAGDCFQWLQETQRIDFPTALAHLREQCGDTTNTTTWNIADADGNTIAPHVRYDHPDGSKSYSWPVGTKPADLPLYGLKHLFDMGSAAVNSIIITEGEKSADALIKIGYAALGTVTGASSCPNQEAFAPLIGFDAKIILWQDNDEIGRSHMNKVAGHLKALGMEAYGVTWTDAPPHGDAHDFVRIGGDVQGLLAEAKPWDSPYRERVSKGMIECDNPPPDTERDKSVTDSVTPSQSLSDSVLAWVKGTSGWWATEELDRDLGMTAKDKENRRQILHRFKDQGLVEQHPKVNKQWRYVDKRVTALDFRTAPAAGVLPVRWPMGIERFVRLFPGNIAVVAGSPNAGKTALLLDFIRLNQEQFPIFYFCSEMGPVELRNRLDQFPGLTIEGWHFDALERASDFEDVIRPDCVNVVDYLEMTDELYRVNSHLTAISHKIGSGLAIVALQKKENAKYGRGQEFSMEKPKLYLSMDKGKLTIVKGKAWANPKVDPNGLSVNFKITGGCQFTITQDWGGYQ